VTTVKQRCLSDVVQKTSSGKCRTVWFFVRLRENCGVLSWVCLYVCLSVRTSLNFMHASQYPVARSSICSWHPSTCLATPRQRLCVQVHSWHMGLLAHACLSRCSAMNALPPAAPIAWHWQVVPYMAITGVRTWHSVVDIWRLTVAVKFGCVVSEICDTYTLFRQATW